MGRRVAGVHSRTSLSKRDRHAQRASWTCRRVHAPAFVERTPICGHHPHQPVSPGFTKSTRMSSFEAGRGGNVVTGNPRAAGDIPRAAGSVRGSAAVAGPGGLVESEPELHTELPRSRAGVLRREDCRSGSMRAVGPPDGCERPGTDHTGSAKSSARSRARLSRSTAADRTASFANNLSWFHSRRARSHS